MNTKNKKPRFLAPRVGTLIYVLLLAVSLVFTQALRSPASAILFIFLLIIPVLSILYLIIARAGIKVYTECDNTRVDKGQPVSYEIKLINETPIPFPFVETVVTLPSENAAVCRDELMRITLVPMGAHIISSKVSFPLRGSYDIGVKYLYIGDVFGLFRTELKLELHRTVIVYPRSIAMASDSDSSDTDLPTSAVKRSDSAEYAEPSDIRGYVAGDPIKNIHWKLSSKSDELQVKSFSSNTDNHTYILCDLSFAGEDAYAPAAPKKQSDTGKRKRRRRGKAEQSAAVASAKSVGDAGGSESTGGSGDIADRLAALGVTDEKLALIADTDTEDGMNVSEIATRRGARHIRRGNAERIARLAVAICDGDGDVIRKKPSKFDRDKLPYAGELAADSAIELALSVMRHEVRRGSACTVLYPDSRSENGIGVLSSASDIHEDPSLLRFYTAPVCRDSLVFSKLAMAIDQSSGVTLRIVSANTDLNSAAVFSQIPAAFGGAVSGCIAEVLIASPSGIWANEADRAVSARAMSAELARSGIGTRQFSAEAGADGGLRFTSAI